MANPGKIVIDHEDAVAALATWWKAIFLTPVWAFIVIMPLGALFRTYWPAFEFPGFCLILGLSLIYFVRDMGKRRIVIDDTSIHFSLSPAPLSELESMNLVSFNDAIGPVFLPKSVLLKFKNGRTMTVMLTRLNNTDLERLVEIVGRRVSHCKIDPAIEAVLRRRKPQTVMRLENPDKFEAQYKSSQILDELPQVLKSTVHNWARLVGPVGTFILCIPLWIAFNLQLYRILRNYEDVGANQQFYNSLVVFLTPLYGAANQSLAIGRDLSLAIAASPVVVFLCGAAATYGTFYLVAYALRSMLGANHLTVDRDEISLDRFFDLFSFTDQSAKWQDIYQVSLEQPKGSADPNKALIRLTDKNNYTLLVIAMASLTPRDREKLSLAITKFAGRIASNLTEALEPSQNKSYTELWLKSLSDTPGRKKLEPLESGHLLENCRYEVTKKLGVGGEGVAYLAVDLLQMSSGKTEQVVLKETLIPPFVDKQVQQGALERFEREARLLKELKSEYVVGLRDYFIEDHRCYLVLDYVDGKNLRQYIADHTRLSESEVLDLAKQMCVMLGFLHDRGVIHRDFTPDNLIIQENGKLKLIDFNVARESDQGKTGTIVGKHAYVPPEQFRGKPTKQSDIYALGATLHFLLTGHDPEPISQSNPAAICKDISPGINALVQGCTALDVSKRLQSVSDVLSLCQGTDHSNHFQAVPELPGEAAESPAVAIVLPLPKKEKKSKIRAKIKEKAN